MIHDLYYKKTDTLQLKVLGIGHKGTQMVQHLVERQFFKDVKNLSYTSIYFDQNLPQQSTLNFTAIPVNQDQLVLEKNESPDQTYSTYIKECMGQTFNDVDGLFIITDFRDPENIDLTLELSKVIASQENPDHFLMVATINQPPLYEGGLIQDQYHQGKRILLEYCDTVIINPTEKILDALEGQVQTLANYYQEEHTVNSQSLRILVNTIIYPSLTYCNFFDVYTTIKDMGKGIVVSDHEADLHRASRAANSAIRNLEKLMGNLGHSQIDSVLVYVCCQDIQPDELTCIHQIIHHAFLDDTRITISAPLEKRLDGGVEVIILAVKKRSEKLPHKKNHQAIEESDEDLDHLYEMFQSGELLIK
ncbi:MAG: hypothetical protein KAG19_05635 [Methylococcales bacterium]|nr:hypothetical protein [Methylococcales bacterium]